MNSPLKKLDAAGLYFDESDFDQYVSLNPIR